MDEKDEIERQAELFDAIETMPGRPGRPAHRRHRTDSAIVRAVLHSKKLQSYAGAIAILAGAFPAIGSLIVSIVTATRGEPVAEQTWITLRDKVNEHAKVVNLLNMRLNHIEGVNEGKLSADLQRKLNALQKRYDELIEEKRQIKGQKVEKLLENPPSCKPGQVFADGRCKSVPKGVEQVIQQKEQEAIEASKKLLLEKKKIIHLKQRKPSPILKTLPQDMPEPP